MLVEYRNRQYEIDGTWNDGNLVLSLWFPLKPISDEQWKERAESLRRYLGHHIGDRTEITALELLDTVLPGVRPFGPSNDNRLAVLQARYEPRAIEDIYGLTGQAYGLFGVPAPTVDVVLSQDVQQHALSAAGRGIENTYHGYLLWRSAADSSRTA